MFKGRLHLHCRKLYRKPTRTASNAQGFTGSLHEPHQTHRIVNAWADPKFSAAVRATGRKKLVMAAVTTDICLIFPAISAVQEGFDVLAVLDASGSAFDVQEELARRRMATAGVVLTTTNTAAADLVQDWSTPQGSGLVQLIMASEPNTPGYVG